MKRCFNSVQADLARELEALDLRMLTFSALIVVVDNAGLRQSELAQALSVERPNLVVIVDELEKRGLIKRTQVPTDRRAYALTPTAAGKELYHTALKVVQDHEAKILAGLTDEQVRTLRDALKSIQKSADG